MPYFDEPVGRVKIQTTSKNTQRYYTTTRQIFMSVRANFVDIYLRRMGNRSMQSGTELAQEIQVTEWSTAGEQGKLVLVVLTTPSLAQFIPLSTTGKTLLSIVQIAHQFKFFTLRFLSRKNVEKKFVLSNKIFFVTSIQFVACALRENLSNRSSGVQIPCDICTLRSAVG